VGLPLLVPATALVASDDMTALWPKESRGESAASSVAFANARAARAVPTSSDDYRGITWWLRTGGPQRAVLGFASGRRTRDAQGLRMSKEDQLWPDD
jgi:hypothetical protein